MSEAREKLQIEELAREIATAHLHLEGPLLPILHAVQEAMGYVPEPAIPVIADVLNLTRAEVYGVVTFYHDFRQEPAGRHVLKLCRAEACQSMGGRALQAHAEQLIGEMGSTSGDGSVTLEPVYCLGLCAQSPAVMIDNEVHGRVSDQRLTALVEALD